MKIFLGCDHAAFEAKEELKGFLESSYEVIDCGCHSLERCDYPDFAKSVASHVQKGEGRGILICGSGIGISMAANRYQNIRAALCRSPLDAELSVQHNNSNVLCMGARTNSVSEQKEIVEAWMKASFEEGRHTGRVNKFNELGEKL